jgi:sialate O-acetylesterase
MKKVLIYIVVLQLLAASVSADVRLPNLFSDNMVLQRDKVIKVLGWAVVVQGNWACPPLG